MSMTTPERRPVFRTESRTAQRFIGLPGLEKARIWPTVDAILAEARADHQEIGDQIVLGALNSVLIESIIRGRYDQVHDTLGKLLGLDSPAGKSDAEPADHFPAGKSLPAREEVARRPLARATR